jgi:hypothetical protein
MDHIDLESVMMVAADAEEGCMPDVAQKLLDEHAPKALLGKCPTCGSASGKKCVDLNTRFEQVVPHVSRAESSRKESIRIEASRRYNIEQTRIRITEAEAYLEGLRAGLSKLLDEANR